MVKREVHSKNTSEQESVLICHNLVPTLERVRSQAKHHIKTEDMNDNDSNRVATVEYASPPLEEASYKVTARLSSEKSHDLLQKQDTLR